jgi:hypothetical protein
MARRRIKDPLPHLPPIVVVEPPEFTRKDVAEMFGSIDPSIISKDASAIGILPYISLSKEDVWRLYVLACYRRVNPGASRQSFIDLCEKKGDEAAMKYVQLAGGSREDCDRLIENFIARKQTKPLIV